VVKFDDDDKFEPDADGEPVLVGLTRSEMRPSRSKIALFIGEPLETQGQRLALGADGQRRAYSRRKRALSGLIS
jgi:hypothetical protein